MALHSSPALTCRDADGLGQPRFDPVHRNHSDTHGALTWQPAGAHAANVAGALDRRHDVNSRTPLLLRPYDRRGASMHPHGAAVAQAAPAAFDAATTGDDAGLASVEG